MRQIAIVILFALTACQSAAAPGIPSVRPAAAGTLRAAGTVTVLPPGTYLATVACCHGTIRYFSLSGSIARMAGEAHVDAGSCTVWLAGEAQIDQQHGIDFPIDCGGRLGFAQVPAGVLGKVALTRKIVTRFRWNSSYMSGAIDSHGNVAITMPETPTRSSVNHHVLVYGPNANGSDKPSYSVPLRTARCPFGDARPGKVWATADRVAYSNDGTLIVEAVVSGCGPAYVERFPPGSTTYSGWFMPIVVPGESDHRQPFFTTGNLVIGPQGNLFFGAFFERPTKDDKFNGVNGAVEYASDASGLAPSPKRSFGDAGASFGGKQVRESAVVGVDHSGNTYVRLIQGEVVNGRARFFNHLAMFGPHANGTNTPTRSILVPASDLSAGSVIVDVTK